MVNRLYEYMNIILQDIPWELISVLMVLSFIKLQEVGDSTVTEIAKLFEAKVTDSSWLPHNHPQ